MFNFKMMITMLKKADLSGCFKTVDLLGFSPHHNQLQGSQSLGTKKKMSGNCVEESALLCQKSEWADGL